MLKDEAVLNDYVKIVNLPKANAGCPRGKQLIVSGWGKDRYTPKRKTERLWAVLQECLPHDKCKMIPEKLKNFFLCVGDATQTTNSACRGDSGGNIFYNLRIDSFMILTPLD